MYASEMITCGLGAVVAVLLGAGVGGGWHYLADSASGRVVVAAATPLAQQDASNPALSCPPPREGPIAETPRLQSYPAPTTSPTQPTLPLN
jgi:hypothetical protein